MRVKLSTIDLTRYFFLATSAILIVFGAGSLMRIGADPDRAGLYGFYAVAMFCDAAAMLFCVWRLYKRMKYAVHISVAVLAVNILLTIFDQFGLVDLLFVLLNVITLAFLISARKEFLPA
jgi:uncharacterized membrane protein